MSKPGRKGVEAARSELPALLAQAERGRTTIITRHGRSVAALVPLERVGEKQQKPLVGLAGSGKGLWGKDSAKTLRRLREEWER
jgi:antitoxin (DNA-binding transcriptional repressor) of toxin-antitoxin stability system